MNAVTGPANDMVAAASEGMISKASVAIQIRPAGAVHERSGSAGTLTESCRAAKTMIMAQHLSAGTACHSLPAAGTIQIMIRCDGLLLKAASALEIVAGLHVHAMMDHSLAALKTACSRAAELVAATKLAAEILRHVALADALAADMRRADIAVKTADATAVESPDWSAVKAANATGTSHMAAHAAAIESSHGSSAAKAASHVASGESPHVSAAAAKMAAAHVAAAHVAATAKMPSPSVSATAVPSAAVSTAAAGEAGIRRLGDEQGESAGQRCDDSKMRSHDGLSSGCFENPDCSGLED